MLYIIYIIYTQNIHIKIHTGFPKCGWLMRGTVWSKWSQTAVGWGGVGTLEGQVNF